MIGIQVYVDTETHSAFNITDKVHHHLPLGLCSNIGDSNSSADHHTPGSGCSGSVTNASDSVTKGVGGRDDCLDRVHFYHHHSTPGWPAHQHQTQPTISSPAPVEASRLCGCSWPRRECARCCMFRSRRSTLLKRLWRLRASNNEAQRTNQEDPAPDDLEVKSLAQSMLKRLKEPQLEILLQALESKGGETTECVLLPKGDLKLGRRMVSPHVLCCQLFRWPGMVKSDLQMKRLACCSTSSSDLEYVCCNPHHWSLLLDPEFPPIPGFENLDSDDLSLQRVQTSSGGQLNQDTVSTETGLTPTHYRQDSYDDASSQDVLSSPVQHDNNRVAGERRSGRGEGDTPDRDGERGGNNGNNNNNHSHHNSPLAPSSSNSSHHHWCSIAYWEMRERVGRLYVVREPTLNVFQRLPHGGGMCLELLQSESQVAAVRKTREKIGLGLIISKEGRSVWGYNRSQFPLFVNSPTLEEPNCRSLVVWKVPPGHSLRLFDYQRLEALQRTRDPRLCDGPYDPWAVRISFAKGWGPCYSRQFLTSCPCWLEILLKEVKR